MTRNAFQVCNVLGDFQGNILDTAVTHEIYFASFEAFMAVMIQVEVLTLKIQAVISS
jgi:hypothetical protein